MDEDKPRNQAIPSSHGHQMKQEPDELNCPSHNRKRWHVDRTWPAWHAWLPMHRRSKLRWALAVVLAVLIIAILIVGIVYATQYYARYYAAKTAAAVRTMVGGGVSTRSTLPHATATSTWAVGLDDKGGLSDVVWGRGEKDGDDGYEMFAARYLPMIHQTTPCLEEYGCAKYNQPAICCDAGLFYHKADFDLSNSGIYCCNNSTCPPDGHLTGTICPRWLKHCTRDSGGGCCPPHSQCVKEGCLVYYNHERLPAPTASSAPPASSTTDGSPVMTTVHKIGEIPDGAAGCTRIPLLDCLVLFSMVFFLLGA